MTGIGVDQARAAAFAEQALGIVNGGFLSLMLSIGHRTRLFEVLATLPPATSDEIAAASGLQERYVREWLGAMVTGRIVDYDPSSRRYVLPPEHAAALTRASGPDNLAELAQLVSTLGNVEDRIVDVFRRGGGVGYDAYERFHDWMSEASRTTLEATLLTRVLPQVPGLTPRLESGIDVLDVGCGLGDAVIGGGNISRPTHCTTVSLAVGGEGLGACWGVEKAREYLSAAGFASVDTFTVDGDPFNVYFRCAP